MTSGLTTGAPSASSPLDDLDPRERIDTMVEWFHDNFEDPVHETPYNSEEGGYLFIWGGPYDAREQLSDYFPDATDEEAEEAVDEIEAEGIVDWAPARNRIRPEGFDDDASEPSLSKRLVDLRQQLDDVETGIKSLPARPMMMGHNRPPEEFRDYLTEGEKAEALQSIDEVRLELTRSDAENAADVQTIQRAENRLRSIAIKLWGWVKGLGAAAAVGAAKELGGEAVKDPTALLLKIEAAVSTLSAWGHMLTSFF